MKINLFVVSSLILLTACGGGDVKQNATAADTVKQSVVLNPTLLADSIKKNNPAFSQHFNEESPLKYVQTSEDYTMFGVFCGASSYAKKLHNEDWVLLAPMNKVFKVLSEDELRELKRPENKKFLDEFVGRHIIRVPFSIYKVQGEMEVENILGQKVKASSETLTIDGAKYTSLEFKTRIGTVVCMEEAIGFDPEKIKALSKKGK
ncbi:MAG: fasciclin domain-containing protein [Flavobacteriales bacterium]|nr:fasciclin domain-containing protein [Flavobacteriales bacterium]